jgi:DNA-binding winged helix-turn-helix (wHTH) protein
VRLQFGDVEFDSDRRLVQRAGVEVHLSTKAFELLKLLLDRRPNPVPKRDISDHLWPGTFVSETNLPTLIAELRTGIGDDAKRPRFIRTVHGFGYAFEGDVIDTSTAARRPHTPAAWFIGAAGEFPLYAGENVIGREGVDVVLDSPTVSRRHARVIIDTDRASIEDLGSKNGTYVNDRRLTAPFEIVEGDAIRAGALTFTFRVARAGISTETIGVD